MNLTVILLLAACLQVSAAAYSQERITLTVKNAPLETVFKAIRKQTGYTFFCKYEWLQQARRVDIEVRNASLEQVLDECFRDQPFTYTIIKQTIIVRERSASQEIDKPVSPQAFIDVHGHVEDESGRPLAGVTVTIKGTKTATTTDANGEFTLHNADKNATLIFTSVNMEPFELKVNGKADLYIKLKAKTSQLDEVQIIAYGATTQRYSTGDIATVKSEDIEKQPVSNPLLALEGRVPGLFISQATGQSGSGVSLLVQGQNSIQRGNDPFYVIDGIPYTPELLANLGGVLGSGNPGLYGSQYGSPLSFINPSDIESISVLKDADATAIYGSRAANGAILITTKKGKAGPTKVDINLQNGWGQVPERLHVLNLKQYLEMREEAIRNDLLAPASSDYDINGFWDTTRTTDWQKALIGGTAQYTNLYGSVSGGNANTQFLVGGTYHRETPITPGDFSDQKGSIHFSLTNSSNNQRFKLQLTGSYLFDNNQLPNYDFTANAIDLAPDAPKLYNPDGTLNWAQTASGTSSWYNPLAFLYNRYQNKTGNLLGNALLSYQILPGLEIKGSLGYNNLQSNESVINPLGSTAPENRAHTARTSTFTNNDMNSWIIEPQLIYKRSIGGGKLEALIGSTIEQHNSTGQELFGTGYNSDQVITDIHSATNVFVISTTAAVYKYNAGFGRLNYNWQGKYILDLNVRRDGSSRFGSVNQFHNFGSAGAAWIFSQENFFHQTLPFMSFGKLRASYGTTGNDQIGDYQFLSLWNPVGGVNTYDTVGAWTPAGLANPYLQWEETRKLQAGADLGFLKDRLLLTVNYFHNRSSNELLSYNLSYLTGFNSITANFPATVDNSGWEFTLNSTNVQLTDFRWSSSITLTIPRNKLAAFPNLATSSYAHTLVIGQPVSLIKAFHYVGVDPQTGRFLFSSFEGNATPTPNGNFDKTALINTTPRYYGGFDNTFQYKGIALDVFFTFVKQIGPNYYFGSFPGQENENQPTSVLSRWQKPGDIAPQQRFNSNFSLSTQFNDAASSDAHFSDASYVRLKNLSLSWQLPDAWTKKARMQMARLYVQGQNLFTITNYLGLDPETRSSTTLPPLRVVTVGLQVGL